MPNLFLLTICFVVGLLFRKSSRFPENTSKVLNGFILYVSLPALVLLHIHDIKISRNIFLIALMPWIVFSFSAVFFYILYKFNKINLKTAVCLMLTAGLGNTSFVGIPLLEAYLGKASLGYAIIVDQMGTFLTLSFPGIIFASIAEQGNWKWSFLLKRIFTFPPAIALLFAFLLLPYTYPEWAVAVLQRLGDTLTPLALVSVGFMLNLKSIKGYGNLLFLGLITKLILMPVLIILIYKNIIADRIIFETIILESAMAPMVTSTILAVEYKLVPDLATLMLGLGIPLSFATTYLFLQFLKMGVV